MNRWIIGSLLISLGIAGGFSLLATESPDGLESSMASLGIDEGHSILETPMADYEANIGISYLWRRIIAGTTGTLVVFGLVFVVGACLNRRRGKRHAPPQG